MNCEKALPLLSGLIDNEIAFEERETVERHLHECEDCFALFLKLKEDSARLQEAFATLKPAKEQFMSRTAALITERERPHTASATSPVTLRRSLWSRIVVPASISGMASAAAFVMMAALSKGFPQGDAGRGEQKTGPVARHDNGGALIGDFDPRSLPHGGTVEPEIPSRPSTVHGSGKESDPQPGHEEPPVTPEPGVALPLSGSDVQEVIDQLIAAIQNADTSQIKGLQDRLLSATTLSQRIVDQLKERFEGTDDPLVREALAKLLTSIDVQDDAMGDFFLRQARLDASVPVRRLLVDGLLNHPSVGSEDLLRQILLQEDDAIVKIKAIDALGVLRSDKAVEVLRTVALADKNDDVKLETIRVLMELGDPELIQSCLDIIRSRTEKFDVQQQALDAVDKMPDREAKKQVLESLTGDGTPRPEIRARAKALYLKASGDH